MSNYASAFNVFRIDCLHVCKRQSEASYTAYSREYQDDEAVFSIPDDKLLEGKLPGKKIQLVKAWIIINQEDLMANWNLAIKGSALFKIKPLT